MCSLNISERCPFAYFDSNMKIKLSAVPVRLNKQRLKYLRCVYPKVQLGLYYHYILPILTSYHLNLTSITENCHYRTLLRPSANAFWILAGKESTIFQLKYPYLEIAMFGKMFHFTKSNITSAILKLQTSARYQIKAKCQDFLQSFSNLMYHS